MKTWDPLLKSQKADTEIISAAQKREIKNILKSYVGMYDSFSELIQNAMDAVDRRAEIEQSATYRRKLWLTIDLRENSFSVVENGIGFNEKEFESFLAPNISFKDEGTTRGNKGVGATYIGYGFDYLQFGTKGNGHEFVGVLARGRQWVEDYKGLTTRPVVVATETGDAVFSQIERGSIFKIKFGGQHIRPKDLSWYGATTAEQWLYLLLIKTPLGSINYVKGDNSQIAFDLTVIDKNGHESTATDVDATYKYPHVVIKASVNLKEVIERQRKLLETGKDPSVLPAKYMKSNGIYEFLSTADVQALRSGDEEFASLVDGYRIEAYGYFTYSTSVWDQLNDKVACLRKGYRVLRGGLQLANNTMIQGELIAIPLTSNIGYQNQCHIIVHFSEADPDLGRKGFQPELKEVAEKIAVAIVNRFKKWRKLLKVDTGVKPEIAKEIELHEWIKEQEAYEVSNPLTIDNPSFFAPVHEISITSEPQSEQDVIVLFNQLIAGGVIRGIKLLATSQAKQYDSLFKFVIREPLDNHVFDHQKNPLGVEELHFNSEHTSAPKILEYKYNLDALIHEFESEYKNERDIHMCVTWHLGDEWRKSYDAISFLDIENLHLRDFHGLTHKMHSSNTSFYVVGLAEMVAYLNDVEGVQAYHKSKYEQELS